MVRFENETRTNAITTWLTNEKKTFHVGIIGAGIGGLAAAIAFRRAGIQVTVLEAAEELGEV